MKKQNEQIFNVIWYPPPQRTRDLLSQAGLSHLERCRLEFARRLFLKGNLNEMQQDHCQLCMRIHDKDAEQHI